MTIDKIKSAILAFAVVCSAVLVFGGFITVPYEFSFLGKNMYMVLNIAFYLLFFLIFGLEGVRGRIKPTKVLMSSVVALAGSLIVLALGELYGWVCSLITGAEFILFGVVKGVPFENIAMAVFVVLSLVAAAFFYYGKRAKAIRGTSSSMRASAVTNALNTNALTIMYGGMALQMVLSAVLLFGFGENTMFFLPFALAVVGIMIYRVISSKTGLLLAIAATLVYMFSYIQALAVSMTIGALGVVAMIALLNFFVLLPLSDLYLMQEKKIR